MITCPEFKFCFLHLPCTGGTSIDRALVPHAQLADWVQNLKDTRDRPVSAGDAHLPTEPHSSYQDNEEFFRTHPHYRSVAFVRNPWERLVSVFYTATAGHGQTNFRDFIRRWPEVHHARTFVISQKAFVGEATHVGRFENLVADATRIFTELGIPNFEMGHEGKHIPDGEDWRTFYDRKSIDRIALLCEEDVEAFGYLPPEI